MHASKWFYNLYLNLRFYEKILPTYNLLNKVLAFYYFYEAILTEFLISIPPENVRKPLVFSRIHGGGVDLLYVQVADKSSIKSTSYQIQPKSNHLLSQGLVDNLFFEGNILLNTKLLPFMKEFGYSLSNAFEYCFVWLRPDDTLLKVH